MSEPLNAYLVCGGKWHDIDFARAQLLQLLLEHENVRTRVAEDFADTDAIAEADFLVTYTCTLDVEELGFEREEWLDDEPRLVMYLHPEAQGEVLYLTLGHCRGKYDMRPMLDVYPRVERGAWKYPIFSELLRRGLRWAKGESPATG